MKNGKTKHAGYEEVLNFEYKKPLETFKSISEMFSIPLKTLKTWRTRGELKYPIITKIDGSRRIVVQPKLFASWFLEKKCSGVPSVADNKIIYSKQIKSMSEARR
jgi:hypothetical protein